MSYSPVLGRFIQRDPLGYVDGMDAFESYSSNPANRLDSTGHATDEQKDISDLVTQELQGLAGGCGIYAEIQLHGPEEFQITVTGLKGCKEKAEYYEKDITSKINLFILPYKLFGGSYTLHCNKGCQRIDPLSELPKMIYTGNVELPGRFSPANERDCSFVISVSFKAVLDIKYAACCKSK